jgi:signal transduction histidine kinase
VSLRKITLLVVGLTFLGLVAFLTFALETSLLRHFINVEEQMVFISVQRAIGVINGDFDHLFQTAKNWSDREDLRNFVQQPDAAILESYLDDRTFSDLNANLLIITKSDGEVLASKGFDLTSKSETEFPLDLLSNLLADTSLFTEQSNGKSGFLVTDQGPLMLAIQPVFDLSNQQEVTGSIIIGRYLTTSEILRLSGIIQMPIAIETYTNPNLTSDFLTAKQAIGLDQSYAAIPLQDDQIGGYAVLNDIYGSPAYLINIQQRRVIYQNGQLLMRYLIVALLAAGLIFGLTSLYVLETLVLSRLSRLSREVNRIGASGELAQRVTVDHQDELSSLSTNINAMLAMLEQTQATETVLQQSLSQRLEEQNALYESSQIFLGQLDKTTNLSNICQIAVNRFCLDKAVIYELHPEERLFSPTIAFCHETGDVQATPVSLTDAASRSDPVIQAYQSREAVVFTLDETHAAAAFPLLHDGTLFAEIVLYSSQPGFFSTTRMQTLQAFANLSGMALRNSDLFEQVRTGQQRMESLSRRLVEVQEEERKYIAMELHDEIGQILTGLRLLLNINIPGLDAKVQDRLQQSKDLVNELIVRVRQMSLELRPGLLDDLGLLPALLWHFEGYTRTTGIQVLFQHMDLEGKRFSFNIETTAYRVIQEALTNAARYANVKEIIVWAGVVENNLMIHVIDEGSGFDIQQLSSNGKSRGLLGMRERVKFVGGTVTIRSSSGEGTQLTIQIPLDESIEKERS